jgi:short-subunit dehydrogenase
MKRRFEFEGRTAVITGAASGIGAALATDLAKRGCHLALADVNADGLDTIASAIAGEGVRISTTPMDVANESDVEAFARRVEAEHGNPHLLFNNAGVALGGTFEDISVDDFEWLFQINFYGVIRMTRAFLPMFRRADAAHIINVSSLFGLIAPAGQCAYSASKFAVRGFSDSLRHELAGSSIGVTTVHPGGVNTRIAEDARMPAGVTTKQRAAGMRQAERHLVMPPKDAARIILRAVERRKGRALVGRDAHMLALLERCFPARYWSVLNALAGER